MCSMCGKDVQIIWTDGNKTSYCMECAAKRLEELEHEISD